ncbi:hypothetical protein [Bradyrhizobium sp. WSM2793]|uniref:hypothetical protein n=1 Tax=Bradyrhizobium sp. WSM2793 TaxID=1038866 RepID=UPI00035E0844|nr:hypothetical protein [Bradyrhizobium sp. WSM2793]
MIVEHPNRTHAAACLAAEGTRQQEVAAAITAGGGNATVAAAVRTAEIKFYRALRDSAIANGQQSAQFYQALRDLGTGGA